MLLCGVIADRASQHRVGGLQCIEHRALCDRSIHEELELAREASQGSQMCREHDPNHGSV